jgi:hypothetical protein
MPSVDAQWITAKKDWKEAKRRHKMHREQKLKDLPSPPPTEHVKGKPEAVYEKDMDAMRCILYLHGGMIKMFASARFVEPNRF